MNTLSDIGLIGLAVMGENLVLNMESKGFQVYDITPVEPTLEDAFVHLVGQQGGRA